MLTLTLAHADDGVRWEGGLIVVDVHDIDAERGSARQLGPTLVSGDHGEPIRVSDLAVQHDVGLDEAGERRLDHERVVMVTVHDVVQNVRVGALIRVSGRYLCNMARRIDFNDVLFTYT